MQHSVILAVAVLFFLLAMVEAVVVHSDPAEGQMKIGYNRIKLSAASVAAIERISTFGAGGQWYACSMKCSSLTYTGTSCNVAFLDQTDGGKCVVGTLADSLKTVLEDDDPSGIEVNYLNVLDGLEV